MPINFESMALCGINLSKKHGFRKKFRVNILPLYLLGFPAGDGGVVGAGFAG